MSLMSALQLALDIQEEKEKGPAEKDQGICEGGSGVSNEPSNLVAPEGSIRFEWRERGGMFMRSGQLANI